MILYHRETIIRETSSGAKCYFYHYFESFGRETGYARSWGVRPKRGTGLIWAKKNESFNDAIARRSAEYSEN